MSGIVDALSSGASMLARPVLEAAGTSGTTPTTQPGGQGQEFGSASTLGFVVLVLFFIGVAFLARSMAKHLKRAQQNLGTEDADAEAPHDGAAYEALPDEPADVIPDTSSSAERDDPADSDDKATRPSDVSPVSSSATTPDKADA
jgi:hypothetical protein